MELDIFSEVEAQAMRLGLPCDFYTQLKNEDDWSFVIKLNALVEAVCTDALSAAFHAPGLVDALATLDLGHNKHGKVAILRSLNAIAKEQAEVLQLLYELRNKLAHNIGQVSFSFTKHIESLDKNQLTVFLKRAGHGISTGPNGQPTKDFVLANPKLALWISVAEILACLHLEHEMAEIRLQRLAFEKLRVSKD
ncbi:MAG: hypothetical protein KA902_03635 [Arenimonas sp.]|nr:hypothetical protein [Arenimonas sp.]